jgi:septin family protein
MPVGVIICGPSGVGKSTHIHEMAKQARITDYPVIDPDKIDLPEQQDRSVKAFELVHEHIKDKKSFSIFLGEFPSFLLGINFIGFPVIGCLIIERIIRIWSR